MFKQLLRKVDSFLRNRPLRDPNSFILWEDLQEEMRTRVDPWYTSLYWFIRVRGKQTIDFPSTAYAETKWFIQRGRRGWADCDTWSLDDYLDGWMPAALRYLRDHKHGVPMSAFPNDAQYIKADGNHTDEAFAVAEARWDAILNEIIAGFEASRRAQDGLYEKELGAYPLHRPDAISKTDWKALTDERFQKSQALDAADRKKFVESMKLFVEHYYSLWD